MCFRIFDWNARGNHKHSAIKFVGIKSGSVERPSFPPCLLLQAVRPVQSKGSPHIRLFEVIHNVRRDVALGVAILLCC